MEFNKIIDFRRKGLNDRLLHDYVSQNFNEAEQLTDFMLLQQKLSEKNPDLFAIEYNKIKYPGAADSFMDIEKHRSEIQKYLKDNATDRNLIEYMSGDPDFIHLLENRYREEYNDFIEQWAELLQEAMDRPSNNENNNPSKVMDNFDEELKEIRKNIFSANPLTSKEKLAALAKDLPQPQGLIFFSEIQKTAKEVWAIEMAQRALDESRIGAAPIRQPQIFQKFDSDLRSRILDSASSISIATLAQCEALVDLMPKLIDHLTKNPHPNNVKAALHFLKGDTDHMPSGFPKGQALPSDVSKILREFLSTRNNNYLLDAATADQASPQDSIEDFKELWNAIDKESVGIR